MAATDPHARSPLPPFERAIGRYVLYDEIAAGGMATIHLGRVVGAAGFSRTVAVKRLHAQYARDPDFTAMFLDEARIAARIHHPNVVPTLDVVEHEGDLYLVMEYVAGETLARLAGAARRRGDPVPVGVAVAILTGALAGLHAAHEATGEGGVPLSIVHRDVSPQNILVGADGVARVLDFGIAKAAVRLHTTRDGAVKGKIRYMSPEQLTQAGLDRRADVYAAAVVLWEVLAGRLLFRADELGAMVADVMRGAREPPSAHREGLSPALDAIVMRGLALDASERFPTAASMGEALEALGGLATPREVGAWVSELAQASLDHRAARILAIETGAPVPLTRHAPSPTSELETAIVRAAGSEDASDKPPAAPETTPASQATPASETTPASATPASQTTPASETKTSRRSRIGVAAAVVLLGAAAIVGRSVVGALGGARAGAPASDTQPHEPSPAPTAALTLASAPSIVVAALPPSAPSAIASSAPIVVASSSPLLGARPRPLSAPASPAVSALAAPALAPSVARAPSPCAPPYVIEPDGTKRFKKECL